MDESPVYVPGPGVLGISEFTKIKYGSGWLQRLEVRARKENLLLSPPIRFATLYVPGPGIALSAGGCDSAYTFA